MLEGAAFLAIRRKMTAPARLSVLVLAFFGLFLVLVGQTSAQTPDSAKAQIESVRAALIDIDASFKNGPLSDAELQRLRAECDPLVGTLQGVIDELTPKLAASAKRLAELKPKSNEKAPDTDAAAADTAAEQKIHDDLDASTRTARALAIQVDETNSRIGAARRALFADQTFARSTSILNPLLWTTVVRETPGDLAELGGLLKGWANDDIARVSAWQWLGFVAIILALMLLAAPLRWVTLRVIVRDPNLKAPSRLRRAIAALWTALVLACLPILALLAVSYALDAFDLSYPQLQGVQEAFFDGLKVFFVANAIAYGLLAPGHPQWRMIAWSEPAVRRLLRVWQGVAAVVALDKLLVPIDDAVSASLYATVATRGACALFAALLMAHGLRRISSPSEATTSSQSTPDTWAPARAFAWLLTLVIFFSVIIGYVAFATFLLGQIVRDAGALAIVYLIGVVVQGGAEVVLQPKAAIGRSLMTIAALRKESLEQLTVLVQGAARVTVFATAALLLLGPWGIQSQDMLGSLRAAYFGFKYGDVTISISSILAATFVFILGVLITRAVQNWLATQLLPRTRLDDGLRNSIKTIFGYVGFILILALSAAQLGLDFQKLALIAGALSVGIGFGLQSVVNNFVSGLIILWERAVRVGDMVVVGADSGFVRRINVRSTEIETFDRATLIVPNSNLVSGVVKNWVRTDRVGRIIIALNVAFDSDPEEVREILISAAKAQDLVLSIPAPLVLFSDFGDWALKFQLICFVDEIEMADRVKSEMLFDLHRRFREAKVRVPYPRQDFDFIGEAPVGARPA
jgi:small-conductance mechanosensitive channel